MYLGILSPLDPYQSHINPHFESLSTLQETCITDRTCDQYTASKAFDGIKMPGYVLRLGPWVSKMDGRAMVVGRVIFSYGDFMEKTWFLCIKFKVIYIYIYIYIYIHIFIQIFVKFPDIFQKHFYFIYSSFFRGLRASHSPLRCFSIWGPDHPAAAR